MQYTPTGSIQNEVKVFHVSESASVPSIKELPCEFSSAPFGEIRPKFGHKCFRPTLFVPNPFELVGQNFGHLATLSNNFRSLSTLTLKTSVAK